METKTTFWIEETQKTEFVICGEDETHTVRVISYTDKSEAEAVLKTLQTAGPDAVRGKMR